MPLPGTHLPAGDREIRGEASGGIRLLRAVFITALLIGTASGAAFAQELEDEVTYGARDSMVYDLAHQSVYLFGAAQVRYQDVELTADRIRLDLGREIVQAFGSTDSAGMPTGLPEFTQGGHKVTADTIRYDFRTKEGVIKEVRTAEEQLYAIAHLSKRHANGEVHSRGGMLTTCDRPHPHYHFAVSKMIVIPDDKIVAGPAIMKIGKVPTPIAVPFGLFPNHHGGSAGVLIPTWGNSNELGYFLLNGGYYLPLGDSFDEQLTADIYSRGSWGLRSVTRYKSRYRFSGSLDLQHSTKLNSLPEYPDFSKQRNFFVRWNHLVDPKASLTDRFNASVNVGSSQNFTNNFNSSTLDYLSNTFQSNVSWNHLWLGKPYSISAAMRHSQNTLTRTFDITLPSLTFNVQRFFPAALLHPGTAASSNAWYDQIGVNWTTNFDNKLTTTEDQLSLENLDRLMDRMRNGVRNTGAITTSFKTRLFTVNPTINITNRTYFDGLEKTYHADLDTVVTDTVPGVRSVWDANANVALTSKLYGMYTFSGGRLKAIRHVITPSATLSYIPGNDTRVFGPFGPGGTQAAYSPFDIGIYGAPSPNASGILALGLVQSVEAKVRGTVPDVNGDLQDKKIKLLDFLGINANYDLLKDSVRWSPVSIAARTQFFNKVDLNLTSSWDPYATDSLGRNIELGTHRLDGRLAHLRNATAALGFELQSKRYGTSTTQQQSGDPVVAEADPGKGARINFSLPWHLRVNYSYSVSRTWRMAEFAEQQTQSVLFSGDVNILKYWKLGFSSGYDLEARDWTPTSLNLYWDLHCWEFNVNVIPLGVRKSFMFRINVKASVLHDLKYELRRPFGNDGQLLY